MNYRIRLANENDAQAVHDLYGAYVEGEHVTFTDKNPSVEAYREKIIHTLEKYPFFIAEDETGTPIGYVCGSELRPHDAYRWNVESTIILAPKTPRRQGIGTALYNKFFEALKIQGYQHVYAVIVDTNDASLKMHEALGFENVGHFTEAGYKLGKWKGIVWMKKYIGDGNEIREPKGLYKFYGGDNSKLMDIAPINDKYAFIKNPFVLYDLLSDIWCADTCAPRMRDGWTKENKTLGQCSITAFLTQDIFGGEVYGILRSGGNYHCYNMIDGQVFDLTSEQFGDEVLIYENNPIQKREDHFGDGSFVTGSVPLTHDKYLRYKYLCDSILKR